MRNQDVYKNPSFKRWRAPILDLAVSEILPILPLLKPKNNVVFDVGANIGLWSVGLLFCAADQIRLLHLFEPAPDTVDRINQLRGEGFFADDGVSLTINTVAMGAVAGRATMYYDDARSGLSTLTGNVTQLPKETMTLGKTREVEVQTIDGYCEQHGVKLVDYVKVDTEGFEMEVLSGARRMLQEKKIRHISIEFGLNQIRRRQYLRDFWDIFSGYGYSMSLLPRRRDGHGYNLVKVPEYLTYWERFDINRYWVASAQ